jgi:hypothetical protein
MPGYCVSSDGKHNGNKFTCHEAGKLQYTSVNSVMNYLFLVCHHDDRTATEEILHSVHSRWYSENQCKSVWTIYVTLAPCFFSHCKCYGILNVHITKITFEEPRSGVIRGLQSKRGRSQKQNQDCAKYMCTRKGKGIWFEENWYITTPSSSSSDLKGKQLKVNVPQHVSGAVSKLKEVKRVSGNHKTTSVI